MEMLLNPPSEDALDREKQFAYKPYSSRGGSRAILAGHRVSDGCPHGSRRRSTVDVLPAGGLPVALTHAQLDT